MYLPKNYEQINVITSQYNPAMVKAYNNEAFKYWERSLFQRAASVLKFNLYKNWNGPIKDFFVYSIMKYGFLPIFESEQFGLTFNPATLSGYNWYYQPTKAIVTNPALDESLELIIGEDCEIVKLTPDYAGIFDIISYFAEKLAVLDNSTNVSLINLKFSYLLGARNKAAAEALKKIMDKLNKGEPAVVYDTMLQNDRTDKEQPFQFLERKSIKENYITTQQLADFQTILNMFDAEIGIPTVPYQKKERMVDAEATSKENDAIARCTVWADTLNEGFDIVNERYKTKMSVEIRNELTNMNGGDENVNN